MGEMAEFKKCAEWVKNELHFEHKGDVSFFETTIRVLGGAPHHSSPPYPATTVCAWNAPHHSAATVVLIARIPG